MKTSWNNRIRMDLVRVKIKYETHMLLYIYRGAMVNMVNGRCKKNKHRRRKTKGLRRSGEARVGDALYWSVARLPPAHPAHPATLTPATDITGTRALTRDAPPTRRHPVTPSRRSHTPFSCERVMGFSNSIYPATEKIASVMYARKYLGTLSPGLAISLYRLYRSETVI